MTVDQYARRKLALINRREGTNHGEDYLEILQKEVADQFMYSDLTLAAAGVERRGIPC